MPEFNSNLRALNNIMADYGLAAGRRFEIDAWNALAVHFGGSGGHQFNVDALNEIISLIDGNGTFQFEIDAINEVSRVFGGRSNFAFVEDALSEISDLPVFIPSEGGGGGEYVAEAVHFDGATQLAIASLANAGGANTDKFSVAFWVRPTGESSGAFFASDPAATYGAYSYLGNSDAYVGLEDSSFTNIRSRLFGAGVSEYIWLFCISTGDMSSRKMASFTCQARNISSSNSGSDNDDIGTDPFVFSLQGLPFVFGGDTFQFAIADVADVRIMPGVSLLDESDQISAETLALFIDENGKPVDPSVATAALGAPCILFSGNATTFVTNQGTGGAFTLTGTLTNATTSPSD